MPQCLHCGKTAIEVNTDGWCQSCAGDMDHPQAADRTDSLEMSRKPEDSRLDKSMPVVPATVRYLGDYELLAEIGRGGMGVVYKARQASLNRIVAVKMILAGQFARESEIKRFRTEAEAAANLQHPGIVIIYEVGEFEGHQYYSMDYVEGDSLATLIHDRNLPLREAVNLVVKTAHAVHYANQRGIIHRDLKPSNILVDGQGQPKVVDFGLAKQAQVDSQKDGTLSGTVLGTPAYMSPEQAQGKSRQITAATDVYSLGAILYHLVAGRPPFVEESSFATLKAVVEKTAPKLSQFNPAVDADLETICLKCLRKEPARRYVSAGALAEDLERWLNHEPISARSATVFRQARMWMQRQPVVFRFATVSVIAMLACGIMAWVALQQRNQTKAAGDAGLDTSKNPKDGIPFAWRAQFFGAKKVDSPQAAATADPDGDGCTNYQEFLAGTNPMDASSNALKPRSISTYAGSVPGLSDGPLNTATFHSPGIIRRDPKGHLWVLENSTTGFWTSANGGHCIRVIDANGIVSTLTGAAEYGLVDGPASQARFQAPIDVAFDSTANAYIADFQNCRIRKLDPAGMVSTFAGSSAGYRDGVGTNAQFSLPNSLVIDAEDNLYVADFDNLCIRKITPDGTVTTYAGGIRGFLDGDRLTAQFNSPSGLALAPDGSLFVGDWINGAVRKISTNGMVSTVLIGYRYVERISMDPAGNLFLSHADGTRMSLRKFNPAMQQVWAITSLYGFRDGDVAVAQFGSRVQPCQLPDGNIVMTDCVNARLRLVTMGSDALVTIRPAKSEFTNQISVTLVSPVPNGVIRYTLDGTLPTTNSPAYSAPIKLTQSATVQAVVFVNNYAVTSPVKASYQKVSDLKAGIPVAWRDQNFLAWLKL